MVNRLVVVLVDLVDISAVRIHLESYNRSNVRGIWLVPHIQRVECTRDLASTAHIMGRMYAGFG